MILDISASDFRRIMNDEELFLPKRWDNVDFLDTVNRLFSHYINKLKTFGVDSSISHNYIQVDIDLVNTVTGMLLKSINHYLNGFPSQAYYTFNKAMKVLMQKPLKVYQKSVMEDPSLSKENRNGQLILFRATKVKEYQQYARTRVFHTPYNLRSKVSTCRYSIAGYPSLYLGTSLELCCKEIGANVKRSLVLAAGFQLERSYKRSNTHIQVIELAVKPQDFLYTIDDNCEISRQRDQKVTAKSHETGRQINKMLLESRKVKESYLLWYPLIAVCSFIRARKKDPFAAEYIIPQLLMQWIRNNYKSINNLYGDKLIGIRYFSCVSEKASDMGFNYVFPTSGRWISSNLPYCSVLTKAFQLTAPVYVNRNESVQLCERKLAWSKNYDFIGI